MKRTKSNLLRLISYLRPFKKEYIKGTIFSLCNILCDIAPEILIGVAIDVVVHQKNSWLATLGIRNLETQLLTLGLLTFLIWGGESLFQYLYSIKWGYLAQSVQHALRLDSARHIQQIDQASFDQLRTGNLISILNDDVNQLERFLENGVHQIIQVLFSTLTVSLIFFLLSPPIALIAITPIPLIIFGGFFFQHKLSPKFLSVRQKAGEIATRLSTTLTGILTIKSYGAEECELGYIKQASEDYQQENQKTIRFSSLVTPIIRIAILMGFLGTLVYGGLLVFRGHLSVGIYGMLIFLTQRLLWPLTELAQVTVNYQRSMASTRRILDLLDIPCSIISGERPLPRSTLKGEIVFRDITFAYENSHPVFENFSVTILKGKTVAFVGTTGSGKTTLLKLLLRFYEPQRGSILLDGQDIRDFQIQDLRKAIGLVSQDIFLFHGTIAENIAYPEPNVSQERIIAAAKSAAAHDFIMKLPHGYDTIIGEKGIKLSGGQRQRLTFARTIIKNPPILILDEATSAVDNETELAMQQSLEKIVVGRTVIMIAHRLSTIRNADTIHVLSHGAIIESGSHASLLKLDKTYANLWKLQTGLHAKASLILNSLPLNS